MASSLRRSGRVRQPAGDEAGPSSMTAHNASHDDVDGGRPKRKRATSSSSMTASPERARRGNSSTAASPAAREEGSPLRSRVGRRIVVKTSGQGRFNKAVKVGSEDASPEGSAQAGDSEEDAEGEDDDGEEEAGSAYAEESEAPRPNGKTQSANTSSTSPSTSRPTRAVAMKSEAGTNGGRIKYDLKIERDAENPKSAADVRAPPELYLKDADKEKLSVVIHAFAPDLLKMRVAPKQAPSSQGEGLGISINGTTKRTSGAERRAARSDTLDDLLVSPKLSLQRLRDHFIQLQAPLVTTDALRVHVTGSHVAPPRDGAEPLRARLKTISTCLALIDEIARRMRMDERNAQVVGAAAVDGNEYALQMRLPMGDYFTNAVWLSDKDATSLDTGHAHLVNIALAPVARRRVSKRVPTLGERLYHGPSPSQLRQQQASASVHAPVMREKRYEDEDFAKPVSHLYYGAWSSFAPTYDSFDGQLSYRASCALWRAKRDARAVLEGWAEEESDPDKAKLKEALDEINDDKIDVEAVLAAYDDLPEAPSATAHVSKDVDEVLQYNASLLQQLYEMQDSRWRRLVALDTKAMEAGEEAELELPSKAEHAVARHLMDSLTSLLSARPRHDDKSIVPTALRLQAVASSAAVDPALLDGRAETGVWGTFGDDVAAYAGSAAKQPSPQTQRRPASMCDNETIKMTGDAEERAAMHLAGLHAPPSKPGPAGSSSALRGTPAGANAARSGNGHQSGHGARHAPPHQPAPGHRHGHDAHQSKVSPTMHAARRPLVQPQHHQASPRGHPQQQYAVGSQTPFARPAHPSLGVGAPAPPTRS